MVARPLIAPADGSGLTVTDKVPTDVPHDVVRL